MARILLLVLSVLLLASYPATSYPCAVRREIAPCTCRLQEPKLTTVVVACEQMPSFTNIAEVLNNRFPLEQDISLKISFSNLDDLPQKSFKELGMSVSSLSLNFDDLSYLNDSTFTGLTTVDSLSLADNKLIEVPRNTLMKMPNIKTLDLGRSRISYLHNDDFSRLPTLSTLLLPGNTLSMMETNSIPLSVTKLHLGRNNIRDLNGSVRALTQMDWIFINGNQLTSLKDQLPPEAPKLRLIHAANNQLRRLPIELLNYHFIDSLFFTSNDIEALDGVLQRARKLKRVHLTNNKITTLAEDEFAECALMDDIELGNNQLTSLNRAFTPLHKLRILNLTHNHLHIFSINEIRGLRNLKNVDLSHNHIQRITDHIGNQVELETRVEELHLEYNELVALEGALQGIHGLQRLTLNHNKLAHIAPDDLIGLDELQFLDISDNDLYSLEDTSKTFLPRLQELLARNNHLTSVGNEFHGLPVLCRADLSHNSISAVGKELGSHSRCKSDPDDKRYRMGYLSVIIEGNPIVCASDFLEQEELLKVNNTFLKADMSVCPTTTTSSTTTTTTTTTEVATTTSATIAAIVVAELQTTPRTPPVDLVTLILPPDVNNQETLTVNSVEPESEVTPPPLPPQVNLVAHDQPVPPQVIPLSYSPEMFRPAKMENAVVEPPQAHTMEETTEVGQANETAEVTETTPVLQTPLLLVKDQGKNITLVIPMENGVIKRDHAADQYSQKNEEKLSDRVITSSSITNIEIVEIKPLPKEPPSLLATGHESRTKSND